MILSSVFIPTLLKFLIIMKMMMRRMKDTVIYSLLCTSCFAKFFIYMFSILTILISEVREIRLSNLKQLINGKFRI